MRIEIAQKIRPFSHTPGIKCLIPGSFWTVEIFPTLFRFQNLKTFGEKKETFDLEFLNFVGPFNDFTVSLDLEKGAVEIFEKSQIGYFHFLIFPKIDGILVLAKRVPEKGVKFSSSFNLIHLEKNTREGILHRKENLLLPFDTEMVPFQPKFFERLELGIHKAQDWELVKRRKNLLEIFPAWLRLGEHIHKIEEKERVGTAKLLILCEEAITKSQKLEVGKNFLNLFLAGFSGILVPRFIDEEYQGLIETPKNIPSDLSPLMLLKQGAKLIRSLFFKQEKNTFELLPCLFKESISGRFTNLECEGLGTLDMEWSKKIIRRVIFRSRENVEIKWKLQSVVKKFRIRESRKDRGKTAFPMLAIKFETGKTYFLDRFQK